MEAKKTLSDIFAEKDGIEIITKIDKWGIPHNHYRVSCYKCKNKIIRKRYTPKEKYICDECLIEHKKTRREILEEDKFGTGNKKEVQFNKAVEKIKSNVKNFEEYKHAIEMAKEKIDKYGSIPEVMVAIELLKNGKQIIPQQKIGRYKVDFLIPKEKMALEVDGELFHSDRYKGDREAIIQLSLGLDWKIVHVSADKLSKNIKLLNKLIEQDINK